MIFDEIPFEVKEHIFTFVTPNEWINTAKVSNEWMDLTLRSITKVEFCHLLILDQMAEFINQHQNTNYTWVSLLAMMPRLEHLEFMENTEAFWQEISPVCHQLKVLDCTLKEAKSFDWNNLDITFENLVELSWNGSFKESAFLLRIFELAPKLEKITLGGVVITAEGQNKIPKSIKHIFLDKVEFCECSIDNLCEDPTALETFHVFDSSITIGAASEFFDKTPRLKKLELDLTNTEETTSMILENALRKCPALEIVLAFEVIITPSWRKVIPQNIKSLRFPLMDVLEDICSRFSFDWLFQNYRCLQSLEVGPQSWTEFDPQSFYSTKNLKKLVLGNYSPDELQDDDTIDPFSEICVRMIRGSHLVDVELYEPVIDESWRHIFPPTIKRLKLKDIYLSKEAKEVFSPQFICENPSNIEFLSLIHSNGDLPAMDLNAFSGMHKLQELHLLHSSITGECLQSILTHCSVLTDLRLHKLQNDVFTKIPHNLVLPSLRKLRIEKPVDQPSLLLERFPKVCNFDIAIVPPEKSFTDIINELQVVETVDIKIRDLTWPLLRSVVESIDVTKYRYFCLSRSTGPEFSFYLTNSLINACCKLKNVTIFKWDDVLWITYPTSPMLRKHGSKIPSSIDELSKRYCKIKALNDDD